MANGDFSKSLFDGDLYVFCTANLVTGGPELLHQLVHEVNRLGGRASIVYVPTTQAWPTPTEYEHYACPVASTVPDTPSSIVLVPEVMPAVLRRFQRARLVAWWLSVDNYTNPTGDWLARLVALRRRFLNDWHRRDELFHLTQSEYARDFVARRFRVKAMMLGDYIDPMFHTASNVAQPRSARIAYNPKKGRDFVEQLRQAMLDAEFVALQNMSRTQMIACLQSCALYVDFGNHPGKDRIPREAAACGCVVVVGKRGSACYWEDVPLADDYKLDVSRSGWVEKACSTVRAVLADYSTHHALQRSYVDEILNERARFTAGVSALLPSARREGINRNGPNDAELLNP